MSRVLHSSAVTLAVGYVAFGIAALILFAAPLWYAWQVTIQDGRTELLRVDSQRLTDVFHREGPQGLTSFIDTRVGMQIAGERILLFTDSSFRPLAGNLREWPAGIPPGAGTYTLPVRLAGKPAHAMFVHSSLPGGYHLIVGRDQALFASLTPRFWYGLAAAVAVLCIAGVLGGIMIRQAVLARVNGLRQTVQAIMQGDFSHRLPVQRSSRRSIDEGDELNTLSRTINGMLDQIEQLVHGVRDVSNAIAHDLRTPLAELRSRLEELSLTRPDSEETFAEVEAAVADVDRVIRIFNALLRLAEIDSGMRRSGFVQINASELAMQAADFYQPAAELKGVTLGFRAAPAIMLSGDPVLLAQAIGNLIDNALKYTPEGGAIAVAVQPRGEGFIEIDVTDNGPGISDEEKPKVADRFYRGDASRGTPGVGLGLTLVASVAKVHGGAFELTDNHPGLKARMVLASETRLVATGHPAIDPHDRADSRERRDDRADQVHGSARQGPQGATLLQERHEFR
jgi:signal transduction histidine kinase